MKNNKTVLDNEISKELSEKPEQTSNQMYDKDNLHSECFSL